MSYTAAGSTATATTRTYGYDAAGGHPNAVTSRMVTAGPAEPVDGFTDDGADEVTATLD